MYLLVYSSLAATKINVTFFLLFRCAIPGLHNDTYTIQSEAHAALINRTIPVTDGRWDSCHLLTEDATAARDGQDGTTSDMLQSNTSQTQIPCSRWVFDHSVFESTVATDVCFSSDLWCQPVSLSNICFTIKSEKRALLTPLPNKLTASKQTSKETERQATNTQTDERKNVQTNKQTNEQANERTNKPNQTK